MSLIHIIPPAAEPIDLAEAKLQCRCDEDADAVRLPGIIATAREEAENRTGRRFIAGRYAVALNAFPAPMLGRGMEVYQRSLSIPLGLDPVRSIVSVRYMDDSGGWTTLPEADYMLAPGAPSRLIPTGCADWPSVYPALGAVVITVDAGDVARVALSASDNTITPDHWPALAVDDAVILSNSGGGLPAPLVAGRMYYIVSAAAGVYTVAVSPGGSAIDFTTAGSGTHYLGQPGPAGACGTVPPSAKSWMLLRVKDLFDHKGTVNQSRNTPNILGFADRLLDSCTIPRM